MSMQRNCHHRLLNVLFAAVVTASVSACSDSSDDSGPARPAPLQDRYVLGSEDSVPEGVAFDPVERAFYATSLQGGSITRVSADGEEAVFRAADNRAQLVFRHIIGPGPLNLSDDVELFHGKKVEDIPVLEIDV